jgi:hypothetical protein
VDISWLAWVGVGEPIEGIEGNPRIFSIVVTSKKFHLH